MCLRQVAHYSCGHEVIGKLRKCRPFLEKEKSGKGSSFFRSLFRSRPKCKHVADVRKDIPAACSTTCARRWEHMRGKQEKELKRREDARKERAQAADREYANNKSREEEALRLQKEEKRRGERKESNGKSTSTTTTFTRNTQPRSSWPSVFHQESPPPPPARVEVQRTPHRLADPATPPQKPIRRKPVPTRTEAQHAPSRLAERPVLPQAPIVQRQRSIRVEAQRAPPQLADRPMLPQAPPPRVQQPHPIRVEVKRALRQLEDHPMLAQASGAQKTSSTRVETQPAPSRLADRPVLPQTSRAGNRSRTPIPRTQANIGSQGRPTQSTQIQSRLPVASTPKVSANLVSRSNGRHLRHDEAGTLDDPRARLRAAQQPSRGRSQAQQPDDVQTVAARKPVLVSPPAFIPSPSRASVIQPSRVRTSVMTSQSRPPSQAKKQTSQPSPTQSRPPVPPKDKPAVPPKTSWQPKHPKLAPAPLTVRPKASERAVRSSAPSPSSIPTGSSRTNPTTAPRKRPDSVSVPPPRSQSPVDQQQGYTTTVPGYRPNPMFANSSNRQGSQPR